MAYDREPAQRPAQPAPPREARTATRHAVVIVALAALAMVVLVLASSSARFDVWQVPAPGDVAATEVTDPPQDVTPQDPGADGRREVPGWVDAVSRVLALLVAVAVIALALMSLRLLRVPSFLRYGILRRAAEGDVLPEFDERTVVVDVESARAALSTGTARNAIVACWMQLERDAADAGLPRTPSETPTEYVERVIGRSSVDRVPIAELAALYREARFSRHELGDEHRQRALAALERVADALHHDARAPGAVES